jgi:hypothetical protein
MQLCYNWPCMPNDENKISVDVLKHLENLSGEINKAIAPRAKTAFERYPVTFGVLILVGIIALNEGLRGVLKEFGLLDINPAYLLIIGLAILLATGTLYKKLHK